MARNAAENRKLTPVELGKLAKRMVDAKYQVEADRLKDEIMRGFYGDEPQAQNPPCQTARSCAGASSVANASTQYFRRINHTPRALDVARWKDTDPEVPDGKWFKKFSDLTVCGEGELIKTFLEPGQIATGEN